MGLVAVLEECKDDYRSEAGGDQQSPKHKSPHEKDAFEARQLPSGNGHRNLRSYSQDKAGAKLAA